MIYKKIVYADFIDRPNRFIANVSINGKKEKVHVRNTGRCKEILVPGAKLILEDCSHIKTRKTRYSIIAVWKNDMLINVDSQVPNEVVFDAISKNKISGLKNLDLIKREVTYKNSRFDLYFEKGIRKGFVEVKGVTLENNKLAMFPDAPTSRGKKHVEEMVQATKEGFEGYILFLIQMKGPKSFELQWKTDPEFSSAIKTAHKKGVNILVYDSIVTKDSISIDKPIKYNLKNNNL